MTITVKETQGDTLAGLLDGVNTDFLTSFDYQEEFVKVYVNGRLKIKDWDDGFTTTPPRLVTTKEPLLPGDSLEIEYKTTISGTAGGGALGGVPSAPQLIEHIPQNITSDLVSIVLPEFGVPAMSSVLLQPTVDFSELKPVIYSTDSVEGEATVPDIIAPVLINSWADYGAPYHTAGYYKDDAFRVHLVGTVTAGNIGFIIFTLPVGYRPADQLVFGVDSNGSSGQCDIRADGGVLAVSGDNTRFSLDGISFLAEA